jgi:membrane carboxypeptidase/penicillin-binding protein
MRDKQGRGITGGRAAAPIWTEFMMKATDGEPPREFSVPADIRFEKVNPLTGSAANVLTRDPVQVALRTGQKTATVFDKMGIAADETAGAADRPVNVQEKSSQDPSKPTIMEEDLSPDRL